MSSEGGSPEFHYSRDRLARPCRRPVMTPSMTEKTSRPAVPYQGHWLLILCLVGLDYFSSLAYQPSMAFDSAGFLAPLATIVVVFATLFGALPIYAYIAGRSPHGQGVVGLFERAVGGWLGKLLIVILLGFI